ncbi:MAG: hypothetical protein HZB51_15575 [Chloroflexi bacterium]|nr:hypothetical protein [Chloroflexota bacterium]
MMGSYGMMSGYGNHFDWNTYHDTSEYSATAITRTRCNRIAPVYDWIEAISESSFKPWREKLWSWA